MKQTLESWDYGPEFTTAIAKEAVGHLIQKQRDSQGRMGKVGREGVNVKVRWVFRCMGKGDS